MLETFYADESRSLLAAIVESSDDAIISKDVNGSITSWNRGAQRIFGYTAQEAVGQSILMLIPAGRESEEAEILTRIRRGDRVDHFQTVRRTKDARLVNVSVTISPVKDATGTIIGASKVARDITSQFALQEQLRQSEERFRTTLSSIGDAVIATNEHGNIRFMNAVAEKMTGWTEAEAYALPLSHVLQLLNENTRQPVENSVLNVLRTGKIEDHHTILLAKDGTEWPIDDRGDLIWNSSGAVTGSVFVFRNVSERRLAELSAEKLAAIIRDSEDAIVGKDLTGIITNWNEGARRIFGYSEEEIVGQSILTLIPPELRDEETRILSRIRNGERIKPFETIRLAKNGRAVQVSVSVSPIRDKEGHVIGASKIARDITERKQLERSLVEAQKQLKEHAAALEKKVEERTFVLQKTVSDLEAFSYSLTHDLRAPLRATQSFMQIFLEDYGTKIEADGLSLLQKAIGAAQRMDRMVLDLLAFTRLSHEPMTLEKVDIEKLVQNIINDRVDFQPPRAIVENEAALTHVVGNTALLNQCLTNLLDNAVKFVAPGIIPRIRLYSERKDNMIRLWIKDNGIGIRTVEHDQLFRMFERGHGSEYPGTGIGLAIVRKAVERMGGTAGVESEPGKGSRFWLQLRSEIS